MLPPADGTWYTMGPAQECSDTTATDHRHSSRPAGSNHPRDRDWSTTSPDGATSRFPALVLSITAPVLQGVTTPGTGTGVPPPQMAPPAGPQLWH